MAELTEYTWVFVISLFLSFAAAFGIGANDVANAFATSVGAKSITLKQAIFIAAIFEFGGAFFMGSHVAKTIRKGITDLDHFEDIPAVLMFGMMCVCFSVSVWLMIATYFSLPVSTTHTCVGSVLGVAVAARGFEAVNWNVVSKIIVSWFASPVASGVFAVALWKICKHGILTSANPRQNALKFYPVLTGFCVLIVVFYTIYKGTPQLDLDETPVGVACGVSFGVAIFAAFVTWGVVVPRLEERMDIELKKRSENVDKEAAADLELQGGLEIDEGDLYVRVNLESDTFDEPEDVVKPDPVSKESTNDPISLSTVALLSKQTDKFVPDIIGNFEDNCEDQVLEMLSRAETFDPEAELAFSYLQVFSACFDAFAHGANDVANAIGPMAAVFAIWNSGEVEKKVDMPLWILAIGGIGMIFGLALYGYNIITAIGLKLTKLSPSRGFCIELGAALVVITGSRLEIPLSTTHCQVGATVGVGMSEDCWGVNWWLFARVVFGWVITLVVAAFVTAGVFSYAVYAPHK